MRTLILMRHAKAVRGDEAPSDEARALTPRGRRDAAAAGAAMDEGGLKPELALVSTAARTRGTAEEALQRFTLEMVYSDDLYHAGSNEIWNAFAATNAACVIVIGHNPGMGELVSFLIRQAHDGSKLARDFVGHFPTAAFAAFELHGEMMRAAGPRLIAAWKPERGD